jgi:hypothetical protein
MTQTEPVALAYTIVDADTRERFVTEDFLVDADWQEDARLRAERRRSVLSSKYGKQFCLDVWGVDARGNLFEVAA